jgi:hypothetical protein
MLFNVRIRCINLFIVLFSLYVSYSIICKDTYNIYTFKIMF